MDFDVNTLFETRHETGSHYTCNPPVEDTDEDWCCLLKDKTFGGWVKAAAAMNNAGFVSTADYKDVWATKAKFQSWRKGKLNYIVTNNPLFATKHKLATEVCKKLNLLHKEDRITVFAAIVRDEYPVNR